MVDTVVISTAAVPATASVTPTSTTAATTTTTAPTVLDFATPPPPAVLATSAAIAATVASAEAGLLQVNTAFGPLTLRTNLVLPAGAAVQIAIVPGPQPGASLIYGSNGQPQLPGARPADTATAAPEADPTEVVELGQTLQAIVVGEGSTSNAVPLGSALSLRITPAEADPGAAGIAATVMESAGSVTLIDSELGRLAIDTNLQLAPGTLVNLDHVDAVPTTPTPPAANAGLGSGWPALDEALRALDQVAPDIAAKIRVALSPTTAPQLAATLIFLAGSLKSGGAFPPDAASAALSMLGRRELAERLNRDVSDLRRLVGNSDGGDWRIYTLPLLDEHAVQPIRLYLRPAGDDEDPAQRSARGSRFVLDLEMSRLGALQLDGLVRRDRFDLLMRSHTPLTAAMQNDVTAIFHTALEGAGFKGKISFSAVPKFPVAPLNALRPHLGVEV